MKLQDKIFFKKQVNTTNDNLMLLPAETMAIDFGSNPVTLFTAAELWNMRRRKRSILVR